MQQPTIQADAGENGGSQRQRMMARCARVTFYEGDCSELLQGVMLG